MLRRPGFRTRATQSTSSARALRRNAVFMSDVTQRSTVPRYVMIANHIATSAATMSVVPLAMAAGRYSSGTNGTTLVRSAAAEDLTEKPYRFRNGEARRAAFRSSRETIEDVVGVAR